jgi:hypothetical protein
MIERITGGSGSSESSGNSESSGSSGLVTLSSLASEIEKETVDNPVNKKKNLKEEALKLRSSVPSNIGLSSSMSNGMSNAFGSASKASEGVRNIFQPQSMAADPASRSRTRRRVTSRGNRRRSGSNRPSPAQSPLLQPQPSPAGAAGGFNFGGSPADSTSIGGGIFGIDSSSRSSSASLFGSSSMTTTTTGGFGGITGREFSVFGNPEPSGFSFGNPSGEVAAAPEATAATDLVESTNGAVFSFGIPSSTAPEVPHAPEASPALAPEAPPVIAVTAVTLQGSPEETKQIGSSVKDGEETQKEVQKEVQKETEEAVVQNKVERPKLNGKWTRTAELVSSLIDTPRMKEQHLSPTVTSTRFIRDIVLNITNKTGFLQELINPAVEPKKLSSNWKVMPTNDRLHWLQMLIATMQEYWDDKSGTPFITATAKDIMSHANGDRTNELLQSIALGALSGREVTADAVLKAQASHLVLSSTSTTPTAAHRGTTAETRSELSKEKSVLPSVPSPHQETKQQQEKHLMLLSKLSVTKLEHGRLWSSTHFNTFIPSSISQQVLSLRMYEPLAVLHRTERIHIPHATSMQIVQTLLPTKKADLEEKKRAALTPSQRRALQLLGDVPRQDLGNAGCIRILEVENSGYNNSNIGNAVHLDRWTPLLPNQHEEAPSNILAQAAFAVRPLYTFSTSTEGAWSNYIVANSEEEHTVNAQPSGDDGLSIRETITCPVSSYASYRNNRGGDSSSCHTIPTEQRVVPSSYCEFKHVGRSGYTNTIYIGLIKKNRISSIQRTRANETGMIVIQADGYSYDHGSSDSHNGRFNPSSTLRVQVDRVDGVTDHTMEGTHACQLSFLLDGTLLYRTTTSVMINGYDDDCSEEEQWHYMVCMGKEDTAVAIVNSEGCPSAGGSGSSSGNKSGVPAQQELVYTVKSNTVDVHVHLDQNSCECSAGKYEMKVIPVYDEKALKMLMMDDSSMVRNSMGHEFKETKETKSQTESREDDWKRWVDKAHLQWTREMDHILVSYINDIVSSKNLKLTTLFEHDSEEHFFFKDDHSAAVLEDTTTEQEIKDNSQESKDNSQESKESKEPEHIYHHTDIPMQCVSCQSALVPFSDETMTHTVFNCVICNVHQSEDIGTFRCVSTACGSNTSSMVCNDCWHKHQHRSKVCCPSGHSLVPLGLSLSNGWGCDGRNLSGRSSSGCVRGLSGFNQTDTVPRFRCQQCDFDLCDQCLDREVTDTLHLSHDDNYGPSSSSKKKKKTMSALELKKILMKLPRRVRRLVSLCGNTRWIRQRFKVLRRLNQIVQPALPMIDLNLINDAVSR